MPRLRRCQGCGHLSERPWCSPECHQAHRPQDWYENEAEEGIDAP